MGIVRISGPAAKRIGERVTGRRLRPRRASYASFRGADGAAVDTGIAIFFAAPASFTGEDVVELQGHGGPVVMQLLLSSVVADGARSARPGEFAERAFLNGKLDLAQAEAVADLIASASVAAAKGALRSLQGEFSARVHDVDERVLKLRIYVEAAIDFPDEEVDFLSEGAVRERMMEIATDLQALLDASRQGVLLRDGITVAIVGAPNVGKSSLLNTLVGEDRAIVTNIPGTTRDLVRAELSLGGLPVQVVDTAGLRDTADPVEREGVRRAENQARQADLVLVVSDLSKPNEWSVPASIGGDDVVVLEVHNKVDLTDFEAGLVMQQTHAQGFARPTAVRVSAVTHAGIDDLRAAMMRAVGFADQPGTFTARQRHLLDLQEALQGLDRARELLAGAAPGELIAEELRIVHLALGSIVGEMTPDELLGEIFSHFCIGK